MTEGTVTVSGRAIGYRGAGAPFSWACSDCTQAEISMEAKANSIFLNSIYVPLKKASRS